jgi:Probable zinc-ribbon domain
MSPEFREFVTHPRYGQGPRITGLNPESDLATGRPFLHWHSPQGVRIPNTAIAADLSRQMPATVPVTHYFDAKRRCADCGRPFIFFAAEQKYWYEELGFPLESDCVRCVDCRKQQRGLESKRQRYEELFRVRQRTLEENLEMAECAVSLVEAGVFGRGQIGRVRSTLKKAPSSRQLQALWERVHALEGGG